MGGLVVAVVLDGGSALAVEPGPESLSPADHTVPDDDSAVAASVPSEESAAAEGTSLDQFPPRQAGDNQSSGEVQSTSDPGPPPPVHFPTREPAEAPSGQLGDDDVDALSSVSGDERDEPEERNADGTLGLQWSWLSHQVAVGPAAALGYERLWVDFEAIFLFTT